MPQLVKLQKEYKDQGFKIIATHSQNVEKEKVLPYLRSAKINFTVTSFGSIDVPNKSSGIPAAYLFDASGNLVEAGHPATMKQAIVDLIKSEPHFLVEGRKFKFQNKYAARLKVSKAQTELNAGRLAARIFAECGKLASYGTSKPVLTSGSNRRVAGTIKSYVKVLFKKYPDSKAVERVKSELMSYGFNL